MYMAVSPEIMPWQVTPVRDFPWSPEQLVIRSGRQVRNMPFPADRPLNSTERMLVEREGVCASCYRYTGTDRWKDIIEKYGRARTPDEHDRMMEKALDAMIMH